MKIELENVSSEKFTKLTKFLESEENTIQAKHVPPHDSIGPLTIALLKVCQPNHESYSCKLSFDITLEVTESYYAQTATKPTPVPNTTIKKLLNILDILPEDKKHDK